MKSFGRLEFIAFIAGFALMCFELVAARLLAPSIGSSTYVWTSVIGVIIAALAIGYWVGGVVADRRNLRIDVAYLLLASALAVLLAQVLYQDMLYHIGSWQIDPRLQGVAATLLLFAPASFTLGMLSPYLAKLNVTSLGVSGRRVASLGALNSIGGIVGTFLTGFVLLAAVGSHQLLTVLVGLLLATSWLIVPGVRVRARIMISVVAIIISLIPVAQTAGVRDIDTPSAHYQVVEYNVGGRPATGLLTGPSGIQSAVYNDGDNSLVFWYTREMARLTLNHEPERILMLGGGAFTLPQFLARELPDAEIDAVEIDPELLDIAIEHFNYDEPPQVNEYFDDARRFVNQSTEEYDVILVDVYGDTSIPFTFTTMEYAKQIDRLLADDGIVVANIIGGIAGGPCQAGFEAIDAAYRSQLSYGYYATEKFEQPIRANIVALYSRMPVENPRLKSVPFEANQPFYDNRAPSEQLHHSCRQIRR